MEEKKLQKIEGLMCENGGYHLKNGCTCTVAEDARDRGCHDPSSPNFFYLFFHYFTFIFFL